MIINDLDGYYIVFDTKNWNTELDTLIFLQQHHSIIKLQYFFQNIGVFFWNFPFILLYYKGITKKQE